jgi:phospholipid transport system substrate-binding protein
MLSRRLLILAAVVGSLFLTAPVHAQAEDFQAAKDFVSGLANQTIETMRAKGVPDSQRVEQFRRLFVSSVAIPVIGKLVLARHWRTSTPEQQQEFLRLFEDVVVLTWSSRFKDAADDVKLEVQDAKPDVDGGILVESRIVRDKQDPVPLVWRLRPHDSTFLVVDLIAEGTSMVFTYREEYASVINQHGGQVDGLIEELKKLVARLSQSQGKDGSTG